MTKQKRYKQYIDYGIECNATLKKLKGIQKYC